MLDEKKYKTKRYLHFDHRIKISNAESYVTDPNKVSVHSFLPLIHYSISFKKFNTANYKSKIDFLDSKERDIKYSGHLDNHIYKYYSEIIQTDFYNKWCIDNRLDDCILAYRNNKSGKSNIDFAAEVISIITKEDSYILVGDFTKYFDQIDHLKLKTYIKQVLGIDRLSSDWFNVFNSVTKYGYFEKELLDEIIGTESELKDKGKKSYFNKLSEFRKFKKEFKTDLKSNKNGEGIPQGIAISATFANIYALRFDIELFSIAEKYNGIYRRYSDDFIIVVPKNNMKSEEKFLEIERKIRFIAQQEKIEIQESKTNIFEYSHNRINNLAGHGKNHLDYLGFVFDGKTVKMRGKGPHKFYRKTKKLILKAQMTQKRKKLNKIPYRKSLYNLYTDLGINENFGNYITYAKKSQKVFDSISPNTNNLMMNQIKNRKKFIEQMLKIKLGIKI